MGLIAWSCVTLLNMTACVRVPSFMDHQFAKVASQAVKTYRKSLSQRTGRTCLFRKTCSHATLDYLAEFGWNKGIVLAQTRVRSCGGIYTMTSDVFGRAVLITSDGSKFAQDDLSEAMASRNGLHTPHQHIRSERDFLSEPVRH